MKIKLNVPKFEKPMDQPQMVIPKFPKKEKEYMLPMVVEKSLTIVSEREQPKRTKPKVKFKFAIAPIEYETHQITAVPSTKNDKAHLLIESFANQNKEIIDIVKGCEINEKGIHLPRTGKFFFETVITNKEFKQYITFNKDVSEYALQQAGFCWHNSPIVKQDECIYKDINIKKTTGYEYRLKHTPALSLTIDGRLQERPLRDFLELGKLLKNDEKVIVQFGFMPCEESWFKTGEKSLDELSKRIKKDAKGDKLAFNGFECSLRIICMGTTKQRSEIVFRGFNMAVKQLNKENELVGEKIKDKKLDKWLKQYVIARKILSPIRFNKRFILTHKEITHFIKLPQRNLQVEYEVKVKEREQLTIPKEIRGKGIMMGYSEEKNNKIPISIPMKNKDHLAATYAFVGSPRNGKDMSSARFIIEAAKNGHGAVITDVIDEQGRGMSDLVKQNLPDDKVVDIDFTDINNPIYFGLDDVIELIGKQGNDIIANDLVKILELDDKYDSKQLARLVAKVNKCNIYDMYCFLKSDSFAASVFERLEKEDKLLALQLENDYFEKNISPTVKGAVLTRLDEILGFKLTKNMFAQKPAIKLDLEKLINQNKVIICRMRKMGGLGELGTRLMMNLLTLKVAWIKKIKKTDNVTFMAFNEFHQYQNKAWDEMMSDYMMEMPKYRLGFVLIFHTPEKIGRFLWDSIQSASVNYFLFKNTNINIYRQMQEQLKPFEIDICMKTEKYESIFVPFIEGKTLTPIFVKMSPVDEFNTSYRTPHDYNYGTPIDEVEDYIYQREINMYPKKKDKKNKKEKTDD